MAEPGNALVVWGSTGRRLQFSMQDLKMPESLRDDPHYHFYEKQWDQVAGFWFNRVLKESSLQHLDVGQIVELIRTDIAKRWERRRQEQSIHKKRKRLLQGHGAAGSPSNSILLTNVVALDDYKVATEVEKKALAQAVVERVEQVARDTVSSSNVLVDDTTPNADASEREPVSKKSRLESGKAGEDLATAAAADADSDAVFDDRVAVVCTLTSKEKAALAIAHLHHSKFDGRRVLCRFWEAM
ncbi:hypothetical protein N2W54_000554 [Lotmaria passim]